MSDHDHMSDPTGADADSPLEPWIQALADDYNRPPPVPREAIWERIQAARASAARSDADADADDHGDDHGDAAVIVAPGGAPGLRDLAAGDDLARRRAGRAAGGAGGAGAEVSGAGGGGRGLAAWRWPSIGLAAALLLAAGLGWWSRDTIVAAPGATTVAAVLPADSVPTSTVASAPVGDSVASAPASGSATSAAPRGPAAPRRARVAGLPEGARLASAADDGPAADGNDAADRGASAPVGASTSAASYRLAAAQHLGQAEALLTVFRAESTRDIADPSLQRWARELLTTTRLLLDSPAARDQRVGVLLDELEPVLVQIVQLPAARVAEERQLIARSLERSDLLTQLRSVVPAGPAVPQRAGE